MSSQFWDKTEHDFGDVSEGQELVQNFIYIGPKLIENFEPSCSCTSMSFKDNVLTVKWKIARKYKDRDCTTYITCIYTDGSITDLKLKCHAKYP